MLEAKGFCRVEPVFPAYCDRPSKAETFKSLGFISFSSSPSSTIHGANEPVVILFDPELKSTSSGVDTSAHYGLFLGTLNIM